MGTVCSAEDALSLLKERIIQQETITSPPNPKDVKRWLEAQRSDGSWDDIDYSDVSTTGGWAPREHLRRLKILSLALKSPDFPDDERPNLEKAAVNALDYWINRKPVCRDNYWHMAMGRNTFLKAIALAMENRMTERQRAAVLEELYFAIRFDDSTGTYHYDFPQPGIEATGQNKLWLADIHLHGALLKNSLEEVAAAAEALRSVATVVDGEGINEDGSFLQHGPQLYTGGYGQSFAIDISRAFALFHDSPYAFDEKQSAVLRQYFLDGIQWMIRRRSWDHLVLGRQIARKDDVTVSKAMRGALANMKKGDPDHAAEYQAMLDHLNGRRDDSLVGNKHFPRADYTAHRRPKYSFSTRMTSERTMIAETGKGENVQNAYLSQGNNALILDGDEYANIFPCWRWDLIPGGTAPEGPVPRTESWMVPGTGKFVGGVSNGTYGVSAKELDWAGVTGRKSWFYFDDDIVCLGAGIRSDLDSPVTTTINQTKRKSEVFLEYEEGVGEQAFLTEGLLLDSPRWVHHGRVGYFFPQPAKTFLWNQTGVSGDWNAINPGIYPPGTSVTHDLFALAIPHGIRPRDEKYAYVILPGQTREFVREYAKTPQSRVVANTASLQAVCNDRKKVSGAVFWEAGHVRFTPKLSVSVSGPCLVLVDESGAKGTVSVASPWAGIVRLDITREGQSDSLAVDLPGGSALGTSVTRDLP
jgi:chondroitin AC lyase